MKSFTPSELPDRYIDLRGLTDEQQKTVEALVSHWRAQPAPDSLVQASYEEWSKAFRAWVDSHPKRDALVDDSRESIYAGRGQ